MVKHVLPNAFQPSLVLITTMLGNVILAEAGLSFIGIGIQPPGAAWGSMALLATASSRLSRYSRLLRRSPSWSWCLRSTWWATDCAMRSIRGSGGPYE